MKKIPTLLVRGEDGLVTSEFNPKVDMDVFRESTPTAKFDGTAVLLKDGDLFKRRVIKSGDVPHDFIQVQFDPDRKIRYGWVPCRKSAPEDRWHFEGLVQTARLHGVLRIGTLVDGSYELLGEKVQGNPYGLRGHVLTPHGLIGIPARERTYIGFTFDGLASFIKGLSYEGVVWWFEDEPIAKLTRRDFGYQWPFRLQGN